MLKELITFEQLEQHREFIARICDSMRVVDPVRKKIIEFKGTSIMETDFYCYDIWESKKMCDNCISMRALMEREIFIKLEYSNGKIHLVTAIPVKIGTACGVLELLKDVTDSIMVTDLKHVGKEEILEAISSINKLQITDSLTGLYNRRYINETLPVEIMNSSITGAPLTIVLADIDRFKNVNDTYGHTAGDFVLKELGSDMNSFTDGRNGWAARYGGEEFLICFRDTDEASAQKLAEDIRRRIEQSETAYKEINIKVTISLGVCTTFNAENLTSETIIDYADKNLYRAKSEGRNRYTSSVL